MERYKRFFETNINLDKILPGSLFKGDSMRKWIEYNIDYFFDTFRKPLNFIYESTSLFDIESKSFGKDDYNDIIETYNKYKDKGTWFIRIKEKKTYKTKIPNELIKLWLNK